MTTMFDAESAQHLNELERAAWHAGDTVKAQTLAALADAQERIEGIPDRLDASFDEGKAEGRKEAIEELQGALRNTLEALEELAYGKGAIKKAVFVKLFEALDKDIQGAE